MLFLFSGVERVSEEPDKPGFFVVLKLRTLENHQGNLTVIGHVLSLHPERRFAPTTVRYQLESSVSADDAMGFGFVFLIPLRFGVLEQVQPPIS